MKPMKCIRTLCFVAILACLIATSALSAHVINLDRNLSLKSIAPGVYVVSHTFPWQANSLVVSTSESEVLIIDTPYTPEATEKVLKWIDKRFAPKKVTAIVTHYHIDRLGGLSALLARGIPVYGSDHTVQLLKERGEKTRKQMLGWISDPAIKQAIAAVHFALPDHIFPESSGLTLKCGNETVDVYYPGAGHTPDNLVVYLRNNRLLFAGCAIVAQEKLGNLSEADPDSWLKAMDNLARFDAQIVIPGHDAEDPVYTPDLINHTKKLLLELSSKSKLGEVAK